MGKTSRVCLGRSLLFFFIVVFAVADCQALEWGGSLDVTTGFRRDEIRTVIDSFSPPGTLISEDDLKAKNLHIWEVGVKGRGSVCNWFIKGFANWGRVYHGDYIESVSVPGLGDFVTKAHIHEGDTRDYSIGLGYAYCLDNCFGIGPVAGWSYDYMRVKMHHATINGIPDPVLNGLNYKTTWQGPWLGVEALISLYCINLDLGYEYHWSHWHGKWLLAGPDIIGGAFSDRRKAHRASGNVFFIDANYEFCQCYELGLELKYQYWRAKKGHETPLAGSFSAVGFPADEVDKVKKSTWQPFEVQLNFGLRY